MERRAALQEVWGRSAFNLLGHTVSINVMPHRDDGTCSTTVGAVQPACGVGLGSFPASGMEHMPTRQSTYSVAVCEGLLADTARVVHAFIDHWYDGFSVSTFPVALPSPDPWLYGCRWRWRLLSHHVGRSGFFSFLLPLLSCSAHQVDRLHHTGK